MKKMFTKITCTDYYDGFVTGVLSNEHESFFVFLIAYDTTNDKRYYGAVNIDMETENKIKSKDFTEVDETIMQILSKATEVYLISNEPAFTYSNEIAIQELDLITMSAEQKRRALAEKREFIESAVEEQNIKYWIK